MTTINKKEIKEINQAHSKSSDIGKIEQKYYPVCKLQDELDTHSKKSVKIPSMYYTNYPIDSEVVVKLWHLYEDDTRSESYTIFNPKGTTEITFGKNPHRIYFFENDELVEDVEYFYTLQNGKFYNKTIYLQDKSYFLIEDSDDEVLNTGTKKNGEPRYKMFRNYMLMQVDNGRIYHIADLYYTTEVKLQSIEETDKYDIVISDTALSLAAFSYRLKNKNRHIEISLNEKLKTCKNAKQFSSIIEILN